MTIPDSDDGGAPAYEQLGRLPSCLCARCTGPDPWDTGDPPDDCRYA